MNIKPYIDKKFLVLSTIFIVFYNFFFSKFLFSVIFNNKDTDFWATLFILKTGTLSSSPIITALALKFSESPEIFAYFVINVFLLISLILNFQIINSFRFIRRNITFKYIIIVFLSSTFNTVLASRSVVNIRWTLASIIYIVFIINLYKYIQVFYSNNYLIRKIFALKRYKYKFKNIDKNKSFFYLLFFLILFLAIHTFSFYYLLSLISLIFIRLSIFFKQSLLVKGLFVSIIIFSAYYTFPFFADTLYLNYEIYGISEYILILSTFTLHLTYLINLKVRNWIDNRYPWVRLLLMSTSLGFIFPIKFMLTRIYVPYLVLLPLIILTFADKILFKSKI